MDRSIDRNNCRSDTLPSASSIDRSTDLNDFCRLLPQEVASRRGEDDYYFFLFLQMFTFCPKALSLSAHRVGILTYAAGDSVRLTISMPSTVSGNRAERWRVCVLNRASFTRDSLKFLPPPRPAAARESVSCSRCC